MNYIKLIALSPYPIYTEIFIAYAGAFDCKDLYIQLNDNLSNVERYTVLLHELTHARHYKRKCICYRKSNCYLRELHAYRFQLRFALRYEMKAILEYTYYHMTCKYVSNYPIAHQKAIGEIKKQKIWKKLKNYLAIDHL